jgi:hypothetical protein
MKMNSVSEIKALVSVAIPGDGAQALTEAIVRATELAEEEAVTRLATKSDLALLKVDVQSVRTDLQSDFAKLRSELAQSDLRLRSELTELSTNFRSELTELGTNLRSELRTGVAELKVDLVRWMFGSGVTLTALIIGAVYFIVNLKH